MVRQAMWHLTVVELPDRYDSGLGRRVYRTDSRAESDTRPTHAAASGVQEEIGGEFFLFPKGGIAWRAHVIPFAMPVPKNSADSDEISEIPLSPPVETEARGGATGGDETSASKGSAEGGRSLEAELEEISFGEAPTASEAKQPLAGSGKGGRDLLDLLQIPLADEQSTPLQAGNPGDTAPTELTQAPVADLIDLSSPTPEPPVGTSMGTTLLEEEEDDFFSASEGEASEGEANGEPAMEAEAFVTDWPTAEEPALRQVLKDAFAMQKKGDDGASRGSESVSIGKETSAVASNGVAAEVADTEDVQEQFAKRNGTEESREDATEEPVVRKEAGNASVSVSGAEESPKTAKKTDYADHFSPKKVDAALVEREQAPDGEPAVKEHSSESESRAEEEPAPTLNGEQDASSRKSDTNRLTKDVPKRSQADGEEKRDSEPNDDQVLPASPSDANPPAEELPPLIKSPAQEDIGREAKGLPSESLPATEEKPASEPNGEKPESQAAAPPPAKPPGPDLWWLSPPSPSTAADGTEQEPEWDNVRLISVIESFQQNAGQLLRKQDDAERKIAAEEIRRLKLEGDPCEWRWSGVDMERLKTFAESYCADTMETLRNTARTSRSVHKAWNKESMRVLAYKPKKVSPQLAAELARAKVAAAEASKLVREAEAKERAAARKREALKDAADPSARERTEVYDDDDVDDNLGRRSDLPAWIEDDDDPFGIDAYTIRKFSPGGAASTMPAFVPRRDTPRTYPGKSEGGSRERRSVQFAADTVFDKPGRPRQKRRSKMRAEVG